VAAARKLMPAGRATGACMRPRRSPVAGAGGVACVRMLPKRRVKAVSERESVFCCSRAPVGSLSLARPRSGYKELSGWCYSGARSGESRTRGCVPATACVFQCPRGRRGGRARRKRGEMGAHSHIKLAKRALHDQRRISILAKARNAPRSQSAQYKARRIHPREHRNERDSLQRALHHQTPSTTTTT
jgi:hypothetical protein